MGAASQQRMMQLLRQNFSEWGPVDFLKYKTSGAAKPFAFVKYRWRSSAEFAKEVL